MPHWHKGGEGDPTIKGFGVQLARGKSVVEAQRREEQVRQGRGDKEEDFPEESALRGLFEGWLWFP